MKSIIYKVIALIVLLLLLGGILSITKKPVEKNVSTPNPEVIRDLQYLPEWKAQESVHHGVDGNVDYTGFYLVPPAPHTDVISIGEHKVSVCQDIPEATKCFGGGRTSESTVTFTNSTDPFVLAAFDLLQSKVSPSSLPTCENSATNPPHCNADLPMPVPYIGSVTPASAQVGTTITLRGSDLTGFEGDVYFFFERTDGKTARLPGIVSTQINGDAKGAQTARVILKEPCQAGQTVYGDYSGEPSTCDYVQLTPGIYKIYTAPWGVKSNEVEFTVTK